MYENINQVYKDKYDKNDYILENRFMLMDYQLPPEFNLLYKTPKVTKQLEIGNCAAHAACACRIMLTGNKDLDLSRAFLYYQSRLLDNKTEFDCGVTMRNVMKSLHKWGVCENEYMPNEKSYRVPPSKEAFSNAKKYKIKNYLRVNSLYGIKNWLIAREQPVVFGFQMTDDLKYGKTSKNGKMKIPDRGTAVINTHAGLIIGYKDATWKDKLLYTYNKQYSSMGYLLIRNCWSEDWGINGNFWMPYEMVTTGRSFDFWVMEC